MPEANESRLEMGGQAVIEGVLMRTKHGYSVAVRRASSGDVVIRSVPFRPLGARYPWVKAPFLRGAVSLFEMLAIGFKALQFSAEEAEKDARAAEEKQKESSGSPAAAEQSEPAEEALRESREASEAEPLPEEAASAWANWAMTGLLVVSLGIAIGMMVVLPNALAELVGRLVHWAGDSNAPGNPFAEERRPLLYNLISGGFRAVILVGYIWLISRLPDIRRVFQYHGAEHKAVFALESGGPLTVEHAQGFTTLHPRCGTSFLVVVVAVSIVVFAFVAWAYASLWPGFFALPFLAKKALILLGHIVALPAVAGVSYEFLKFSARRCDRGGVWKWLVWPGLQTQRLTTRQPEDAQVEVALVAMEAALAIPPGEREQRIEVRRATDLLRGAAEPGESQAARAAAG